MARPILPSAALILVLMLGNESVSADFVGAEDCRECHEETYATWAKNPHARATETLGRAQADASCRLCHATGDAPLGANTFAGVQCESCHGAGAAYRDDDVMRNPLLARFLGLADLSTPEARRSLCISCHDGGTKIGTFDVEAAWARISHARAK